MIFGLSFSACANAVTTGGVTATAVAPRAVDSSGNIIDVSEINWLSRKSLDLQAF